MSRSQGYFTNAAMQEQNMQMKGQQMQMQHQQKMQQAMMPPKKTQ